MERKIVAIGGGKNGRIKTDGTKEPYETEKIDKEIIRLTGKRNPNFLFLGHAQLDSNNEKGYFETMKVIYGKEYGCSCKIITRKELEQQDESIEKTIEWADIIYEGGGSTLDMLDLWKKTGFDIVLEKAWKSGKVLCGVSAGANCWFQECLSDSLKIKYGEEQPLIVLKGLGFIKGLFVPHCDKPGIQKYIKEITKEKKIASIQISNCAAIEIIDNNYRIITDKMAQAETEGYGLKSYWHNGKYIAEYIKVSDELRKIQELEER